MEIAYKQKVTLTFASGDTSKDGTLSGFTTLGQVVPFTASAEVDADSNRLDQCKFDIEVTSLTNVRVTRGGSGVAATVIVYVVEFALDVTVRKGTWALGTGDTTDDVSISSVTMADAFVWHFHKSSQSTAQQPTVCNTASELQATDNVRIHINSSGTAHDGHFFVVEHSDLNVQRGSFTSTGPGAPAQTISSVTMADAFTICSHTSSETQYEDEGNGYGELASSTSFQWHMGYSSGTNVVYYQVIEDSDLSVQRFETRNTNTASGSFTPSSVTLSLSVAHAGHMIGTNSSDEYDDAWDLSCRCTSYDLTTSTNVNWSKDANNGSAVCEVIQFTQAVSSASYDQTSFRARNDDDDEADATWKAAVNIDWNQKYDENFRVRFLVQEDNDVEDLNIQFQLQYRLNSGTWTDVNASSSVVRSSASSNLTDGEDTTQQLGSGTYISNNDCIDEVNGLVGGANLDFTTTTNQEVEAEFCVQIRSADTDSGDTVELRLVKEADSAFDTYTNTPSITVLGLSYTQTSFRGRNDDGSESAATWKNPVNTNWNQDRDVNFRIRFLIQEVNDFADANVEFQLQYSLNSGTWTDVNGSSSVARSFASSNFTDGDSTTQQIGSGTFIGSQNGMDEVNGVAGGSNLDFTTTANQETELEYCVQFRSADTEKDDKVRLRLIKVTDIALNTYTNTPDVTISAPAGTVTLSTNHTLQEVYDYQKYWSLLQANIETDQPINTADGITFIMTSGWSLIVNTGIVVTATDQKLVFSGGGGWTLNGTAQFNGLMNDGINYRVPIKVTNIINGSRLYIERDSDNLELYNDIISGTSFTFYYTQTADTNVGIRLRNASGGTKYKTWETSGTVTKDAGLSVQASQIGDS